MANTERSSDTMEDDSTNREHLFDGDESWARTQVEVDLGVGIATEKLIGDRHYEEWRHGDPTVAGGWTARIVGVNNIRVGRRGYLVELEGLGTLFEAFGLAPPSGGDAELGPFYAAEDTSANYDGAVDALVTRLIAALVRTTNLAVEASPDAKARVAEQLKRRDTRIAAREDSSARTSRTWSDEHVPDATGESAGRDGDDRE
jgi:hypothetical protein